VPEFAQRGVETIAISADTEERARQAQRDWGLERLSRADAREGQSTSTCSSRHPDPGCCGGSSRGSPGGMTR
jgi:hypothetical protein